MTPDEVQSLAEIQQKIYRYGWCIDHRRFGELDAIFTDDAIVHYDVPGGVKKPWTEMKDWLPGGLSLFRVTQHNMSNSIVDFDGDAARSTTYGQLIHVQHHKDDSSSVFRHYTIYRDAWLRGSDGWLIQARTLSNLYMDGAVHGPDRVHTYTEMTPY